MPKYTGSLRSEFESLQKKQELLFTKAQEEGIIIDKEIDTIKNNIDDLVNMGIKISTKTHQEILDEIINNLEIKKGLLSNRNDFEELQKQELYEKDLEEANLMNTEIISIKENIDYLISKGVNIATKTYQEIFDEITFSLENKNVIGDENEVVETEKVIWNDKTSQFEMVDGTGQIEEISLNDDMTEIKKMLGNDEKELEKMVINDEKECGLLKDQFGCLEIGIMDDNIGDIKEDEIVVGIDGLRDIIWANSEENSGNNEEKEKEIIDRHNEMKIEEVDRAILGELVNDGEDEINDYIGENDANNEELKDLLLNFDKKYGKGYVKNILDFHTQPNFVLAGIIVVGGKKLPFIGDEIITKIGGEEIEDCYNIHTQPNGDLAGIITTGGRNYPFVGNEIITKIGGEEFDDCNLVDTQIDGSLTGEISIGDVVYYFVGDHIFGLDKT